MGNIAPFYKGVPINFCASPQINTMVRAGPELYPDIKARLQYERYILQRRLNRERFERESALRLQAMAAEREANRLRRLRETQTSNARRIRRAKLDSLRHYAKVAAATKAKAAKAARAKRKDILRKKRKPRRLAHEIRMQRFLKRQSQYPDPVPESEKYYTPEEMDYFRSVTTVTPYISPYEIGGPPIPDDDLDQQDMDEAMDLDISTRGQKRGYEDMVDEPLYDDRGTMISM